ncbi:MAG: glycerol-3-phosphate 1-O-acyltransferase PlsY [Armatimonadota bacterium]|nr:MAG: glycerol-3-phosphate 1-O-acyltransferase PlsY [Armatimonadota bacterium]
MPECIPVILVMVGAYLAGSLPFGLWVAKAWSGVDIREVGSGNIGTTNVLRAAGWRAALLVFVLDSGKGAAAVLAGKAFAARVADTDIAVLAIVLGAATMAMLGHTFSAFLGLRGGRGAATGFGVIAALSWKVGFSGLGVFVILAVATRIVSLSSMAGAASMPVFMLIFRQQPAYSVFAAATAALVIIRHAPNIRRLLRGEESKIGRRRKEQGDE